MIFLVLFSILFCTFFDLFFNPSSNPTLSVWEKSVLYLTYNATAVTRGNGIFGSGVTFAPGVGTIHLDSFGVVKKIFTLFIFGPPKIGFSLLSNYY